MIDDLKILEKFFRIFNDYESKATKHMSEERREAWFKKKFIDTGLIKQNSTWWEWVGADWDKRGFVTSFTDEQQESYDRHFEGYYRSPRLGSGLAVRKDFLFRVVTLGFMA
jgi:hypothetical protein